MQAHATFRDHLAHLTAALTTSTHSSYLQAALVLFRAMLRPAHHPASAADASSTATTPTAANAALHHGGSGTPHAPGSSAVTPAEAVAPFEGRGSLGGSDDVACLEGEREMPRWLQRLVLEVRARLVKLAAAPFATERMLALSSLAAVVEAWGASGVRCLFAAPGWEAVVAVVLAPPWSSAASSLASVGSMDPPLVPATCVCVCVCVCVLRARALVCESACVCERH